VGDLFIGYNDALTNLDDLSGPISVGWALTISNNDTLANLDGLSGITSVGGDFQITSSYALHDCKVCDFLDQLTTGPADIVVWDNVDDTCTPVPAGCP